MPCPCPNSAKACCPQNNTFDSLTVTNGLRVLRGPTTLGGTTQVDTLCFKDVSGEGNQWCAQENAADQLCITNSGTGKKTCLLPESGAVQTTGFFADGTEVINVEAGPPQNPSLLLGTTVLQSAAPVTGSGTLNASDVDGQIKRISVVTNGTAYVLTIPDFIHPTLSSPIILGTSSTTTDIVLFSENFDSVTAPALPANWVVTSNNAVFWVTSAVNPDTDPNDLFANGNTNNTITTADTPSIVMPLTSNGSFPYSFTFRNNFITESNFDGGRLQISINSGAFVDIVTAGGVFVSGGYNGFVSGSPGWTGNSGGYITSSVDLPASLTGASVRFRFLFTTDLSVLSTGWRVDTITLTRTNNFRALELQWIDALGSWTVFNAEK